MATTLELAAAIATAVLANSKTRHTDLSKDPPTQAVLRVLRRHRAWIYRVRETPQGTVQTPIKEVE